MKIAIDAADLDHERIDGTRVYILNVLKYLGKLSPSDEFLVYHQSKFNPHLDPPKFPNYTFRSIPFPFAWTQTRFSFELLHDKPDVLWMPLQTLPCTTNKKLKKVVTIHDLAFKYFPEHFPKKDLRRLNMFSGFAIRKSDKIIAVSESTKKDILKFYPEISENKIKIIYHGINKSQNSNKKLKTENQNELLSKYNILNTKYLLYVGAIQPRKNLNVLIEAFENLKKEMPDLRLVLAGEKAWLWEKVFEKIEGSKYEKDIVVTGTISFEDRDVLYQNASVFIFPSLYEGFGIPVLEAMKFGVPTVLAQNSSLPEVGGQAALYFDESNPYDLEVKIKKILLDEKLRKELIEKGKIQVQKFSWEKCARETLEWLKS